MKKKVIIIGGGFAGLNCLRWLSWYKRDIEVTLIDKRCHFEFLPLLPDAVGFRVNPHGLACPLPALAASCGAKFLNAEVEGVDFTARTVSVPGEQLLYDFLVIASGAQTNYYDAERIKHLVFPVNSVDDVLKIRVRMREKIARSYVVAGGGYTGIETATNLRSFLLRAGERDARVVIVEKQNDILGPMPEWMKEYVREQLVKTGVGVVTGATVAGVTEKDVSLSTGEVFEDPVLFWTVGVKTAPFIGKLPVQKTPQGRIVVDRFMRVNESCFACGDAAAYVPAQNPLRMAVQFALSQGERAAANIYATMRGEGLKPYRFNDLGYLVPMAHGAACGYVLGMRAQGAFPWLLHYLFCIYRSCGISNKLRVAKNVWWDGLWDA